MVDLGQNAPTKTILLVFSWICQIEPFIRQVRKSLLGIKQEKGEDKICDREMVRFVKRMYKFTCIILYVDSYIT